MQHARLVDVRQRPGHLGQHDEDAVHLKALALRDPPQVRTLDKFHHHREGVALDHEIVHLHQVRMVEALQCGAFPQEPGDQVGVCRVLGSQHLDGDRGVVGTAAGEPHPSGSALPDGVFEEVPAAQRRGTAGLRRADGRHRRGQPLRVSGHSNRSVARGLALNRGVHTLGRHGW